MHPPLNNLHGACKTSITDPSGLLACVYNYYVNKYQGLFQDYGRGGANAKYQN